MDFRFNRESRKGCRFLLLAMGFSAWLAGPGALDATVAPRQEGPRWTFSGRAGADLWFHAMAMVDPQGPGPLPLYSLQYPGQVREAKERAGVYPTALDRSGGRFREAFQRDRSFEVFHFLPLYFAEVGRLEMVSALKALATQAEGLPQGPTPQTSVGIAAVGSVLRTRDQRMVLGEFLSVLEAEWSEFLGSEIRRRAAESEALARTAQGIWDERFSQGLAPLLSALGLTGGSVILTPALGMEGRVYAGSPQEWRDNVVVVRHPRQGETAEGSVFSFIREISFSLSREAGRRVGMVEGDLGSEAMVATGAIRAGAVILEQALPGEADEFKAFFLGQSGREAGSEGIDRAFQEAFPLDAGYLRALLDLIEHNLNTGD